MEQAYVYKWTERSTGKWYVGSRTQKGCHPNDGYICSSKLVKPMILSNKNNWDRDILYVGNPFTALQIEVAVLKEFDAKDNPTSYNQHNQDLKWSRYGCKDTEEVRTKKSKARQGNKNPQYGKRGFLSPNWGRKLPPKSAESKAKLSAALKGKKSWNKGKKMPPLTDEQKAKLSAALKGKPSHWKGKKNKAVSEANKKRAGIKRPNHSVWMTGKTWICIERICPHCGKQGRGGNMLRYHFDKCKENTNGIA